MNAAPEPDAALRSPAQAGGARVRVRLAASTSTPPDVLHLLARERPLSPLPVPADGSTTDARNGDADRKHVLGSVASRLASVAPWLSPQEQQALALDALDALAVLVVEEFGRVRAGILAAAAEMPSAPLASLQAWARGKGASVAEPVLRLAPTLGDQDLLLLLAAPPASGRAREAARRPDLTLAVSDMVATAAATVDAIAALLADGSAAIRETTLDALIARSAARLDRHEPAAARRPSLSPRSARKLSRVVQAHALHTLATRSGLGAAMRNELARRLAEHGAGTGPAGGVRPRPEAVAAAETPPEEAPTPDAVTEGMVAHAARGGEAAFTVRLLAAAAEVSVDVVQRAAALRSAKGLLSLVWKAGFSMEVAGPVQALLARLAPSGLLAPGTDGGFPLTREEMRWQLDFLSRA